MRKSLPSVSHGVGRRGGSAPPSPAGPAVLKALDRLALFPLTERVGGTVSQLYITLHLFPSFKCCIFIVQCTFILYIKVYYNVWVLLILIKTKNVISQYVAVV
jgi:hypothetical protein